MAETNGAGRAVLSDDSELAWQLVSLMMQPCPQGQKGVSGAELVSLHQGIHSLVKTGTKKANSSAVVGVAVARGRARLVDFYSHAVVRAIEHVHTFWRRRQCCGGRRCHADCQQHEGG